MIHAFLVTLAVLAAIYSFPIILAILGYPGFWKFVGKALFWIVLASVCLAFPGGGIALAFIILFYMAISYGLRQTKRQAEIRDTIEALRDGRPLRDPVPLWTPRSVRQAQATVLSPVSRTIPIETPLLYVSNWRKVPRGATRPVFFESLAPTPPPVKVEEALKPAPAETDVIDWSKL
jgi:hypothetical protein